MKDYILFGNLISFTTFQKLSIPGGLFEELYYSDLDKEVCLNRSNIKFSISPVVENLSIDLAIGSLDNLPSCLTPKLIFDIIGAVLLEKSVIIHAANRRLCFQTINLVLGLISPLVWPYPIVPLILDNGMQELINSPVPLLCGVEEDPKIFHLVWGEKTNQSKNVFHVQLERGLISGKPLIDFNEEIVKRLESKIIENCSKLHAAISRSDDSEHLSLTKKNLVFLYQRPIKSFFLDHLNEHILADDDSQNFFHTNNNVKVNSQLKPKVIDTLLNSQIVLNYLENRKQQLKKNHNIPFYFS